MYIWPLIYSVHLSTWCSMFYVSNFWRARKSIVVLPFALNMPWTYFSWRTALSGGAHAGPFGSFQILFRNRGKFSYFQKILKPCHSASKIILTLKFPVPYALRGRRYWQNFLNFTIFSNCKISEIFVDSSAYAMFRRLKIIAWNLFFDAESYGLNFFSKFENFAFLGIKSEIYHFSFLPPTYKFERFILS